MHTYRGANGLIINYNSDFSGMALLRSQGTEMEIPAEELRPVVEPVLIVREIAAFNAVQDWRDDGYVWCCFCDGDEDGAGVFVHQTDCLWVRAWEIVARLDASSSVVIDGMTIEAGDTIGNGVRRTWAPQPPVTIEDLEAAGLIRIVREGEETHD